jgi:hypothetical protein
MEKVGMKFVARANDGGIGPVGRHDSLPAMSRARAPTRGPVAIVLCETGFLAAASVAWDVRIGARTVIVIGAALPEGDLIAAGAGADLHLVDAPIVGRIDAAAALAQALDWVAGRWAVHHFNGEFPVFAWCERRKLGDLAEFQDAERRGGVGAWTVDLYHDALPGLEDEDAARWTPPSAPLFDAGGCFSLTGAAQGWERPSVAPALRRPLGAWASGRRGAYAAPAQDATDRLRIYGGLGWRMQERVLAGPPRLERTAFVRARRGMRPDGWFGFGDPSADGMAGPWHRSPTMAVMSFRAARALLADPDFAQTRPDFRWAMTREWDWSSDQLLNLGVIEPGQWF